jgi:hypothetical protein
MGCVYEYIQIDGRRCLALFDTGARSSFVIPEVAALGKRVRLGKPYPVRLGGRSPRSRDRCVLEGKLQGKAFFMDTFVIREIGRGDLDRPIEILVGALEMQRWGIELDLRRERPDLSHFSRGFTEF